MIIIFFSEIIGWKINNFLFSFLSSLISASIVLLINYFINRRQEKNRLIQLKKQHFETSFINLINRLRELILIEISRSTPVEFANRHIFELRNVVKSLDNMIKLTSIPLKDYQDNVDKILNIFNKMVKIGKKGQLMPADAINQLEEIIDITDNIIETYYS